MAQTTRVAPSSGDSALEDATETLADWFRRNGRAIGVVVAAAAAIGAGTLVWRSVSAGKETSAEQAFYRAQQPLAQGDLAGAEKALRPVADGYDGTAGGAQAQLMLAQVMYEQGKWQQGIDVLKKADDAPAAMRDGVLALTAAGYEGLGNAAEAAKLYDQAASAAELAPRKAELRASAARAYQAAGNKDAALKIWTELSKDEKLGLVDEARVRIGELSVRPAGA